VHDNAIGDLVVAGGGADWFFVDPAKDIVSSKKSDRVTNIQGW
jgi:hypothetical protein